MTTRPMADVLTAIENVTPEPYRTELRNRLQSVRDSYAFAAPEVQRECWQKAAYILNDVCGKEAAVESDWFKITVQIFAAQRDYREFLEGAG